ncbi:hypothetical protein BLOT_010518 [Blomia tropicalis]|nr:hypothetical protein BLOT_010518 [Blomia tropicalis]
MDRFISIPVILNMAKDPSSSSSSEDCDVNLKSNNQPISNNDVTSDDILLDKKPIKVENDPPLTVEEAAEILLSLSLK